MTVEQIRWEIDRRMDLLGGTPPNELAAIQRAMKSHPDASLEEICTAVIAEYGLQEGVWFGWPQDSK